VITVQGVPASAKVSQDSRIPLNSIDDMPNNMEDTFEFIITRFSILRNSEDFTISSTTDANSFTLQATAADESINVVENYQVQNIIDPHQTNQNVSTTSFAPTLNTTHATIIMGFTYQLIQYKWEISWTLELFGYKIAYAYFGFEIDIGAAMRFPINITVDYFTELLIDQSTSLNITLQTIDLPNFTETYFHFIARLYAGVSAFGYNGEWSIGPNYREDYSYETPLGPGKFFDIGTIEIPLIEILANLNLGYISQIARVISSYVVDVLFKLRFSIGSELISMKATLYGNDTHFDNPFGPSSKTLNFTQVETKHLNVYSREPGPVRLELNEFQYHLNRLNISILLGLTWKTVFAQLFDDQEWQIYSFVVPLGNLFNFDAPNTITIQMNSTTLPEIYDVSMVYLSPMEAIEPGTGAATYYVFLENTGENIEHDVYDISISGIDPSWIIVPPHLTIKQGSIGYFILKIDPPRDFHSSAGIHTFTVTATSQGDPSKHDSISGTIYILPYYEVKIDRLSALDWGIINVTPEIPETIAYNITNTGNAPEIFTLTMVADGLNSSIFSLPKIVSLNPGETITIYPNVTIPKSPDFPALRYSVKLIAQSKSDPLSIGYDMVQMYIRPYRNLSIQITPLLIPSPIVPGSILTYNVRVQNNGNFNDTIELALLGLKSSNYQFDIASQILFPGQILNTQLTITVPPSSINGELFNLTCLAYFASNQTIQVEAGFIIQTAPNYLPLILTIVILSLVLSGVPYYYRGVKDKLIPYVKRKREARIIRKYRHRPDEIKVKIDYCLYCSHKLSEVDLKLLNSNQNTLCEHCGNTLTPRHLEIWVPKQKSIEETVSERLRRKQLKEEQKARLQKAKEEAKQKKERMKKEVDENIRKYKEKLAKSPLPPLSMELCPFCFKHLTELDTRLLQKGNNTWCPHCKKFITPKDYK